MRAHLDDLKVVGVEIEKGDSFSDRNEEAR